MVCMTKTNLPRQSCCKCLKTTTDYTTEIIDRRTEAEVRIGVQPHIGRFHTCQACKPS